jgi:tRNA-dihydrouridine synthase C
VEAALAIAQGGADELVVHARTRVQGYKPPAHWHCIAPIRQAVRISVVANGEIWTVADALQARAESGCHALMLGRGLVADPGLALALRAHDGPVTRDALGWVGLQPLLALYWQRIAGHVAPRHRAGRLKQWLNLLRQRFPEAQAAYEAVRAVNDPALVGQLLFGLPDTPERPAPRVVEAEAA